MQTINNNNKKDTIVPDDLKVKLAVLERDFAGLKDVVEKLENSIEKLTNISASMEKIIAVHENINSTQKTVNDIMFEKLEQEREQNRKEHDKMLEAISNVSAELKQDFDELKKIETARIEKVENKVDSLEKWRWMLVGGGVVIGAVLSFLSKMVLTLFK